MAIHYFAPCGLGLEAALERELRELGAEDVRCITAGARFQGDRRLGYAANLWLRSAIRVQDLVAEFRVRSREDLYARVGEIDWSGYLSVDQTLAVDASVQDSELRHSKYAALVVKDAIVDQFRSRQGRRPSVDVDEPHLPLKLVLQRDHASLWRNMSGASLHKRGWRRIQVKSPLSEAIAAGLLLLTGWDRLSPLVDPMCGSGTFVIEAAMLAADIAPGRNRRFAFERWPDFDADLWRELGRDAERRPRGTLPFTIEGADRHAGALDLARKGARAAGVADLVRFRHAELRAFTPHEPPAIVVANPPFGRRLGEGEDLVGSWRDLGAFLHERATGATAWILCGNRELTRHLGLRAAARLPVWNGSIECRWLRYDVEGERAGTPAPPSPWVERFAGLVRNDGDVLDIACGEGRHSRFFLGRGHRVTAVDRDIGPLGLLAHHKRCEPVAADLEQGPWPFAERRFDAIIVTNYLWRPLFPHLVAALADDGVLIYDTFARGQARFGKPTNPAFHLAPNELLAAFSSDLEVVAYEHGEVEEPERAVRQRICAVKRRPTD